MEIAIVTGGFDDIRCPDIRFLEEASRQGELHVFLWSDQLVRSLDGLSPKFSQGERMYFLQAIRETYEDLKKSVPGAIGLIRTGDTTQYANIVLVSGPIESGRD